jgi:hypothetical protein
MHLAIRRDNQVFKSDQKSEVLPGAYSMRLLSQIWATPLLSGPILETNGPILDISGPHSGAYIRL